MDSLSELSPFLVFVENNQALVMFLAMTGTIVFALYIVLKLINKL